MSWILAAGVALAGPAAAQDHSAHHEQVRKPRRYQRSVEKYDPPGVELTDQNGNGVDFPKCVDASHPVALNFIFTTCSTICPVMSATFKGMVRELGADRGDLRLVSITIDPEYDTPEVLSGYAARYGADPDWLFLTGDRDDIVAVQKAFDAYEGNKMNHRALTLFKAKGSRDWVRIDGLAGAADLAREYRELRD